MKISTSSSMLLAALAVSSSSPNLVQAAPTGRNDSVRVTPPNSAREFPDDRSVHVSRDPARDYPEDDGDFKAAGTDEACNGAVRKILNPILGLLDPLHLPVVPGLLGDLGDTVDKVLGTCAKKPGVKSFQAADGEDIVDFKQLQGMVANAVVQAMDANSISESPPNGSPTYGQTAPSPPPNTPAMSSEPTGPSQLARELFQRRGVSAPPPSSTDSKDTEPSSGMPSRTSGPPPPDATESGSSEDSVQPMVAPAPPVNAPINIAPPVQPPQPPVQPPQPPVQPPQPPVQPPQPPVQPPIQPPVKPFDAAAAAQPPVQPPVQPPQPLVQPPVQPPQPAVQPPAPAPPAPPAAPGRRSAERRKPAPVEDEDDTEVEDDGKESDDDCSVNGDADCSSDEDSDTYQG